MDEEMKDNCLRWFEHMQRQGMNWLGRYKVGTQGTQK